MADDLVVVGAGGFGRETIDVVRAINATTDAARWRLRGVVDDAPSAENLARLRRLDIQFLGTVDDWARDAGPADICVGVGDPAGRRALVMRLRNVGATFPTLVHPSAVIGSDVEIGEGAVICGGASIGTGSRLGEHVHLNPHAVIGHDAILEAFVSVNPNATISGACWIHPGTLVGAAAVVLQGCEVGFGTIVGAGAVVTRDVPAGRVVKGSPAK